MVIFTEYYKKNLHRKWLTIYVNDEQHLPYWKLIYRIVNVVIVPKTGSGSSLIHHQRGIYFHSVNYYEILKEHLQLIHKLHPREFQVTLKGLSVLKF